jgi:DNA-binding NtrC family response regulator
MSDILVCIGDHPLNQYLANLLSGEGYRVEVTQRGSEAIHKILSKKFKAVILGMDIEGMSGEEVISIVNKIDTNLPIIAIAADDSLETARRIRSKKIFYYFIKPINDEEMRAVVRDAIRKKG